MTIRMDKKTGKMYTWHNIPYNRLISIQNEKGFYKIFESNHSHPNDSWYNDIKVCGDYAVFKWENTSSSTGFYQQVSPWYIHYGSAIRKMVKLSQ